MRLLAKGLFFLAVIAAGLGLLAWNGLDIAVKWGIEHLGPELAGVPIKVREVQISPMNGRGAIRGLEVGNPSGFDAKQSSRVGEIRVAIEPKTVLGDVVHVLELSIDSPQITYERGSKATNLDVIQNHLEGYVKRNVPVEEATAGGRKSAGRRYVIDRITIRGARVTMTTAGLKGQGLQFDVPDVELRDLGKGHDGVTAAEATARVTAVLQGRIAQKVLTNVEALRQGGVEGAIDALKGLVR